MPLGKPPGSRWTLHGLGGAQGCGVHRSEHAGNPAPARTALTTQAGLSRLTLGAEPRLSQLAGLRRWGTPCGSSGRCEKETDSGCRWKGGTFCYELNVGWVTPQILARKREDWHCHLLRWEGRDMAALGRPEGQFGHEFQDTMAPWRCAVEQMNLGDVCMWMVGRAH